MSEKSIPLIAATAIISLMFAWMQILNFASPRWKRILKRFHLKRMKAKRDKGEHPHSVRFQRTISPADSVSPLSSSGWQMDHETFVRRLSCREENGELSP